MNNFHENNRGGRDNIFSNRKGYISEGENLIYARFCTNNI